MRTVKTHGHYAVEVSYKWFENNWATIDKNNSIIIYDGCHTGDVDSVAHHTNGRVVFGWAHKTDTGRQKSAKRKLFSNLTGQISAGKRRTIGKARKGVNPWFVIYPIDPSPRDWTTLNPAPNHVFPTNNKDGKGTACILFDTSMSGHYQASSNVVVWFGNATDRYWMADPRSLRYGIRCDYTGNELRLKAIGNKCVAYPSGRYMDGDRKAYGSHKFWP